MRTVLTRVVGHCLIAIRKERNFVLVGSSRSLDDWLVCSWYIGVPEGWHFDHGVLEDMARLKQCRLFEEIRKNGCEIDYTDQNRSLKRSGNKWGSSESLDSNELDIIIFSAALVLCGWKKLIATDRFDSPLNLIELDKHLKRHSLPCGGANWNQRKCRTSQPMSLKQGFKFAGCSEFLRNP